MYNKKDPLTVIIYIYYKIVLTVHRKKEKKHHINISNTIGF